MSSQVIMYIGGAIVGITLGGGLAFAIYRLFFKGKRMPKIKQPKHGPRPKDSGLPRIAPNCFVIYPITDANGDWNPKGGIWRMYVENPPGMPRRYGKELYWWLIEHPTSKRLVPYAVPDDVIELPEMLFDALNCEPARELLAYSKGFMEKANLIMGVVAIAVLLLAVIMAVDLV